MERPPWYVVAAVGLAGVVVVLLVFIFMSA
jgi:hypothetical protein